MERAEKDAAKAEDGEAETAWAAVVAAAEAVLAEIDADRVQARPPEPAHALTHARTHARARTHTYTCTHTHTHTLR
jgi:hypothetical protein